MTDLMLPIVNEENSCLPLAVNVVTQYWNVQIPLPVNRAQMYPPDAGSVIMEGIELAEAHNLTVSVLKTDMSGLFSAIDSGIPPIVVLPGLGTVTQHISVLSGYDETTILHYIPEGTEEGIYEGAIPHDIFEDKWSQEDRIAILIGPSDVITQKSSESLRLCLEAERAMLSNNDDKTRSFLEQALSIDRTNATAWLFFADLQNKHGDDDCINSYAECIKLNRRYFLAYSGLGNYYLKRDNIEKSEDNYDRAIQLDPKRSGSIYKNRAYLRNKREAFGLAADDLEQYVKLSPDAPDRGAMQRAILELRKM